MKRYNDLERVVKAIQVFEDYEDEYWTDIEVDWLKELMFSAHKKKTTVQVRVIAEEALYVGDREVKLKDIYADATLRSIYDNNFDQSNTFDLKPLIFRGKEMNEKLFDGSYSEDQEAYIDQDCPKCSSLLVESDEESDRVLSGTVLKCSELGCNYYDNNNVVWKPFDFEAAKKREFSAGMEWLDLDSIIMPEVVKKFPNLFEEDREFAERLVGKEVYNSLLSDDQEEESKEAKEFKACSTCHASNSFKVHGVLISRTGTTKKSKIKRYTIAVFHCSVCGQDGRSSSTGDHISEMFSNLV